MNFQLDKKKIKSRIAGVVFRNGKKGFVSLIALLLANIFLMIGMSVFAISIKELSLSFGGRESNTAFYAADGGMECALYWDIQEEFFATSTPPSGDINCANHDDITITYTPNGLEGMSSFDFSFGSDDFAPCATVTVEKLWQTVPTEKVVTRIISRGRNNCNTFDPRRVERAWKVTY